MKILQLTACVALLFSAVGLTACQSDDNATGVGIHNAKNSLDWAGIYEGVLPCESCSGIHTRVTLYDSNEFAKTDTYLDNDDKFTEHGDIVWDQTGQIVTLVGIEAQSSYKVIENGLLLLGIDGEVTKDELGDEYRLTKRMEEVQ